MNKSLGLVLLFTMLLLGAVANTAQAQMAPMAMGQAGNIPQFMPVAGWNVQDNEMKNVRGLENIDLPCMISTNFDNGYVVRFSGFNGQMLAMAIDFRQDVFTQGRKYNAKLSLDQAYNQNISATAFSKSTLIFNMRPLNGFYNALASAGRMTLDIQDNPMTFNLGNVQNGLTDLQSCSGGAPLNNKVQNVSAPTSMPSGNARGNALGQWGDKVTPEPARVSNQQQSTQARQKGQVWQATAGASMKATLDGWAKMAGVKLDWQASQDSKVSDDIRVMGTFEDAVQTLMARNAAASGLDASMKGAPSSSPSMSPRSPMTQVSSAPTPLMPQYSTSNTGTNRSSTMGSKWSAPVGTSLEQVLKSWSSKAGVEFIWQANQGFAVRSPISSNGSYEDALQSLLNQYKDQKIRPAAQLNNDPNTGKKTLYIESSRV